jgi:hypothetical protein
MKVEQKRARIKPLTLRERMARIPEGAFESAMLLIKETFPDKTLGVSDTSFWQPIEERASMKANEACFQFYLRGIGHLTLAKMLLFSLPRFKTDVMMGDISPEEKEIYISQLARVALDYYPPKYREKFSK